MSKLPCPEELWPVFSGLLDDVLQVPEGQRAAWLRSLAPEYAPVLPWLVKVIGTQGNAHEPHFMQHIAWRDSSDSDFTAGQQIGPYVLERRLGGGGMGEVWLAARNDGTLKRRVALKLPHTFLLAGALKRRFERERDILAALSHPHIALLYDAGIDEIGTPYLAMEWVDGDSLLTHCRRQKSSLEQRLELFLQILDAVAYAHGRLVAHRDIKPSNILVTAEPRVKLLDFGIAKLLTGDTDTELTQLTQVGTRLATPDYAAPEQLAGQPITVAVDIYAMGVVLHELLTGQRPLRQLGRASSLLIAGHAATVAGATSQQLRRALSGDLDAIIAKALEPLPVNRYASADAFAQDLRLSRQNRPIAARRIGALSLSVKYARRHWLGVSMAAGLLLVIIAGSLGIAWQGVRAAHEAQRATTIKDFLIGVFRASDPRIAHDKPRGEITARELLDVSTATIDREFAQQRATQIELLGVTAEIYRELDETKRSTALYARETELASELLGRSDAHTIEGLLGQAYNAVIDGDTEHALELLTRADPLIAAAALDRTATRARWLLIRGEALAASPLSAQDAGRSLSAAIDLFGAVAPHDAFYADALIDLGAMALERSQFVDSAGFYRRAIQVASQNAKSSGTLLPANAGLAVALKDQGEFTEASRAFEAATRIAASTHGRDSHSYWAVASDWARFRYERGERQAALRSFEDLLSSLPNDPSAFRNSYETNEASQVLRKFGRCLAIDGQGARAIELLKRAERLLKTTTAHAGDDAQLQFDLGKAYDAGGVTAQAQRVLQQAVTTFESWHAPASQLAIVHERWGRFLLSQRQMAAASLEFERTLQLSSGRFTEAAIYAAAGLGALAVSNGDKNEALAQSGQAMQQLDRIEGSYDVRIFPYVWEIRARALRMAGDDAGARALSLRVEEAQQRYVSMPQAPGR